MQQYVGCNEFIGLKPQAQPVILATLITVISTVSSQSGLVYCPLRLPSNIAHRRPQRPTECVC